jgi:ABC-type dipeptide/oligopeptide/nickel transport system permease subunit
MIKDSQNNDFNFVQKDKKIYDVKLATKPTTYFSDALKRFRKNKASVAAGLIIGILTFMAITVPIFNTNNVERPLFEAKFLPPRWPGVEKLGILDGTTVYSNVIIDIVTDPTNPTPVGFRRDAIVGDIKISDTFSNFPSPYAFGGKLVLRASSPDTNAQIQSSPLSFDFNEDLDIKVSLSPLNDNSSITPIFQVVALVEYQPGVFTTVPLNNYGSNIAPFERFKINETILLQRPDNISGSNFRFRIGINLQTTSSGEYPALYIDSVQLKRSSFPLYNDIFFNNINFTSGNEVMLRDLSPNNNTWNIISGSKAVFQAIIPRGTFRYDNYLSAFGDVTKSGVGISQLEPYIQKGWISYDPIIGPTSFVLIDELRSPIRQVIDQETVGFGSQVVTTVTAVVSVYREKEFTSIPYYIFGTDINGNDYFKIVFSGLSVSLLLGLLVAIINVSIGMVWGALSGYYGGWIDIAMERITEILGGVPWIVLMTLTILLLGSNFWTFLLALTLTGWIGTASLTRSQFYRYKRREYVLASRTLGAKDGRLIFRHILPNSIGPIVTTSVLIIPGVIFSEAAISFLGLGLQGLPSLGVALSRAQGYLQTSPHLTVFGSIVISLLLISFNLFGNGLRDAFNPSLKGISE